MTAVGIISYSLRLISTILLTILPSVWFSHYTFQLKVAAKSVITTGYVTLKRIQSMETVPYLYSEYNWYVSLFRFPDRAIIVLGLHSNISRFRLFMETEKKVL